MNYDDFDEEYHKSFADPDFQSVYQTREGVLWAEFMQQIEGKDGEELVNLVEEYVSKGSDKEK